MDPLFHQILSGALAAAASDIHIKPQSPVVFRLDRQLVPIDCPFPTEDWILTQITQVAGRETLEKLQTEFEADFAFTLPEFGRFRANAFRQRGQLTLALRLVKSTIRSLEELRLPAFLGRLSESHRGILLVTGAIGAGKSTTLAALIDHLNRNHRKHIVTLEDPIEYLFEDRLSVIEQREVGIDTHSFANGLRHVLRQDPDIIVIGEMRDAASAAAAMTAASIGHLVISTLHTPDTARSLQRILDFFPGTDREHARRLFSETLLAVSCQRLIASENSGVIPAVEILVNTPSIAKLIAADRTEKISAELELGSPDGMQTFDQALQEMVRTRQITQAEAIEHAANPEALRMLFKGVVLHEGKRILGSRVD
jgi:twitching motility protein PilT